MITRFLFLSLGWLVINLCATLIGGPRLRHGNAVISTGWWIGTLLLGDVWALLTFGVPYEIALHTAAALLFGLLCIRWMRHWNAFGQATWGLAEDLDLIVPGQHTSLSIIPGWAINHQAGQATCGHIYNRGDPRICLRSVLFIPATRDSVAGSLSRRMLDRNVGLKNPPALKDDKDHQKQNRQNERELDQRLAFLF